MHALLQNTANLILKLTQDVKYRPLGITDNK